MMNGLPAGEVLMGSKPRCERCYCVLSQYTFGDVCMPCLVGEIDIPDWAIALVESDPSPAVIARLVQVLTGERPDFTARNAAIDEAWAAGGVSQAQIGRARGLKRTTVEMILRRKGGGNGSKGKAAGKSGPVKRAPR